MLLDVYGEIGRVSMSAIPKARTGGKTVHKTLFHRIPAGVVAMALPRLQEGPPAGR